MSATPLFVFPKSLIGKRPAMDVTGHVQQLYQQNKVDYARSFETHQQYLDALNSQIGQLIGVLQQTNVTPTVIPPPASVIEQSLSAGFTIPINVADPTDTGQLLYVFLRAAGPTALFTWGTMFRFASTEFDSTGGLITVFSFVSKVDAIDSTLKWWQTCAQWTGQS